MENYTEKILLITHQILDVIPLNTKAMFDLILVGIPPSDIDHTGYMGWWAYFHYEKYIKKKLQQKNLLNESEFQELLKSKEIISKLNILYDYCQKEIIIPMMKDIVNLCKQGYYQSQITKLLHLDKLESIREGNKHWIMKELLFRLEKQNILFTYIHHGKKYCKVKNEKEYIPPNFVSPTSNLSKGMIETLSLLQNFPIIKKIELEYKGPIINQKNSRFDIAIFINKEDKLPIGFIEYDGDQHHIKNERMHGIDKKGLTKFLNNHLADKLKNNYAEKETRLGILRLSKNHNKPKRIEGWLNSLLNH